MCRVVDSQVIISGQRTKLRIRISTPLGDRQPTFAEAELAASEKYRICHLSFVICHLSFVICHLSFVICHLIVPSCLVRQKNLWVTPRQL